MSERIVTDSNNGTDPRPSVDQDPNLLDDSDIAKIISRKTGGSGDSVINWRLEPITSTCGFMGSYYQLIVTVNNNNANQNDNSSSDSTILYFFAKTPPPKGPQREFTQRTGLFNKEIVMYDEIIPRMGSGFEAKWSPDCYLCKRDVIIVMEDLKHQNYTTLDKYVAFDYEVLECLFESFARFHSRSFILEERLRVQGKTLRDIWPDQLREGLFSNNERSMLYQKSSLMGIDCLVNAIDCLTDNQKEITMSKITRWWECLLTALEPSRKYRNVICHRDVWSANFMFLTNELGKPINCRLIDFQYYSYLNPAMDLILSLYMITNRNVRDKYFDILVQHYYNCLKQCLYNESFDVDKILPWDDFKQSCQDARPWGLIYIIFNQQVTLLDDDACEKYFARSPQLLEHVLYGTARTELVSMQFQNNHLYREKFTENIFEIFQLLPDQVQV
ncbi:uncharacterized protein LOC130678130 [Microplitis mediator]|uniref:uncharacterized protein LOC130678130 n=1 Tax=Microplitis mediator TaxID=375433 RepID=UPI00255463BD|nr:uncharacterized protein LOC130678130 [Microplitis mediator]